MSDTHPAAERTRTWLREAVVGLGFCPFAKGPLAKGQVRFAVCESDDPRALLDMLAIELARLAAADPAVTETTLLIHPHVLQDFDDYNDFLDAAEALLVERGHEGVLQIASFHPAYRFAGTEAADLQNATNRSPCPMLHLLREASVARAVASFPEAATVYEANIATLARLGDAGWAALARHWAPED